VHASPAAPPTVSRASPRLRGGFIEGSVLPVPGPRVRRIRRAEALVAQSLLAGEAARSTWPKIPRRTRQTVTYRLYNWNWFTDREVASPATLGCPWLTFALTSPYVEQRREVEHRWRDSAEACLVWSMEGSCFGVFASSSSDRAATLRGTLEDGGSSRNSLFVTVDLRAEEVPIWFDFEGAWSRTMAGGPSLAYPVRLPPASGAGEAESGTTPSWAETNAIRRLVARQSAGEPEEATARPTPSDYSGLEEKVHREGWVTRRTFLNPGAVSRTILGFPGRITFLHGFFRSHDDDLVARVLSEGAISPFLLAHAGEEVLLGAMGRGSGEPLPGTAPPSRSVASTLSGLLDRISVAREPTSSLRVLVDHRYDQILSREAAGRVPIATALPRRF
jgi:hypothetical protein